MVVDHSQPDWADKTDKTDWVAAARLPDIVDIEVAGSAWPVPAALAHTVVMVAHTVAPGDHRVVPMVVAAEMVAHRVVPPVAEVETGACMVVLVARKAEVETVGHRAVMAARKD